MDVGMEGWMDNALHGQTARGGLTPDLRRSAGSVGGDLDGRMDG